MTTKSKKSKNDIIMHLSVEIHKCKRELGRVYRLLKNNKMQMDALMSMTDNSVPFMNKRINEIDERMKLFVTIGDIAKYNHGHTGSNERAHSRITELDREVQKLKSNIRRRQVAPAPASADSVSADTQREPTSND